MRDIVLGEEQIRIPLGFEVGIMSLFAFVDLVFVSVDQLQCRFPFEFRCCQVKGFGRNRIVVVEQRDELSGSERKRIIGCRRDAASSLAPQHFNAIIAAGVALHNFPAYAFS